MLNLTLLLAVIVMAAVASLGEKRPGWRAAAYAGAVLVSLAVLGLGLAYLSLAAAQRSAPQTIPPDLAETLRDLHPLRVGLGLAAGGLLSWVALLPPVRQRVARVVPIRPDSVVNAVALAFLVLLWALSVALSGLGPQGFLDLAGPLTAGQVVMAEVPLALLGIVAVGLFTRRSPAQTWERLGLTGLTWRQVALSVAGAVGLVAFEVAFNWLAGRVAPQAFEELNRATNALYGNVNGLAAAATIAVASGVAEEVLFRGALQPRFGLVLTALSFAVLHLQYGVTWALLSVGLIGLVLGLYRERMNTSACILVHALYNLAVFLLPS